MRSFHSHIYQKLQNVHSPYIPIQHFYNIPYIRYFSKSSLGHISSWIKRFHIIQPRVLHSIFHINFHNPRIFEYKFLSLQHKSYTIWNWIYFSIKRAQYPYPIRILLLTYFWEISTYKLSDYIIIYGEYYNFEAKMGGHTAFTKINSLCRFAH